MQRPVLYKHSSRQLFYIALRYSSCHRYSLGLISEGKIRSLPSEESPARGPARCDNRTSLLLCGTWTKFLDTSPLFPFFIIISQQVFANVSTALIRLYIKVAELCNLFTLKGCRRSWLRRSRWTLSTFSPTLKDSASLSSGGRKTEGRRSRGHRPRKWRRSAFVQHYLQQWPRKAEWNTAKKERAIFPRHALLASNPSNWNISNFCSLKQVLEK